MFDVDAIFKERLKNHLKRLNRYLRYIFNGHFMIAILFTIVTLSIYYQQWLSQLSPDFRADIVVALLLTTVVMYNPFQLFLQEADKVFLIVQEKEMRSYFRKGLIYNYGMQLYIVLFTLAAITPLIQAAFPEKTMVDFIVLYGFVFLVKWGHLHANWWSIHLPAKWKSVDKGLRFLVTVFTFYFLVNEIYILAGIIGLLLLIYFINDYFLFKKQAGLHWEVLITNDEQRLATFYQFVSMFAEVPALKRKQKERKLLTGFISKRIPFGQKETFRYLYWLTFIRSTEYLNMFVRLTIVGGIAIYFIPHAGLSLGIAVVFLYLTAFQLLPLFHHYRTLIWLDLYPVTTKQKEAAFLQLVIVLCALQTLLFSLLFIVKGMMIYTLLFILVGSLFNYLFHHFYVRKKVQTK